MEDNDVINFKNYCDKFLDYVIKYSYKESIKIQEEYDAYKRGIISKQSFNDLKNARQRIILSYNNLAYKFKMVSENSNLSENVVKKYLNDILQTMLSNCESSIY